jgi:hypothetical protein
MPTDMPTGKNEALFCWIRGNRAALVNLISREQRELLFVIIFRSIITDMQVPSLTVWQ